MPSRNAVMRRGAGRVGACDRLSRRCATLMRGAEGGRELARSSALVQSRVAQLAERPAVNRQVPSSSLGAGASLTSTNIRPRRIRASHVPDSTDPGSPGADDDALPVKILILFSLFSYVHVCAPVFVYVHCVGQRGALPSRRGQTLLTCSNNLTATLTSGGHNEHRPGQPRPQAPQEGVVKAGDDRQGRRVPASQAALDPALDCRRQAPRLRGLPDDGPRRSLRSRPGLSGLPGQALSGRPVAVRLPPSRSNHPPHCSGDTP